MTTIQERNELITVLVRQRRYSYAMIAKLVGGTVTRNTVAGVTFRDRHPANERVRSPNAGRGGNKIGWGWQPRSYYPEKTLLTS